MIAALSQGASLGKINFYYDSELKGIGSYAYFAKDASFSQMLRLSAPSKECHGYAVSQGSKLSFRVLFAVNWGKDAGAFDTPLQNVVKAEFKRDQSSSQQMQEASLGRTASVAKRTGKTLSSEVFSARLQFATAPDWRLREAGKDAVLVLAEPAVWYSLIAVLKELGSSVEMARPILSSTVAPSLPFKEMVTAVTAQSALRSRSFYYSPGLRAIGCPAVHCSRGRKCCVGYLLTDGANLMFADVRGWLLTPGELNDAIVIPAPLASYDSGMLRSHVMKVPLRNIDKVEFRFGKSRLGTGQMCMTMRLCFGKPVEGLDPKSRLADVKWPGPGLDPEMSVFYSEMEFDVFEAGFGYGMLKEIEKVGGKVEERK